MPRLGPTPFTRCAAAPGAARSAAARRVNGTRTAGGRPAGDARAAAGRVRAAMRRWPACRHARGGRCAGGGRATGRALSGRRGPSAACGRRPAVRGRPRAHGRACERMGWRSACDGTRPPTRRNIAPQCEGAGPAPFDVRRRRWPSMETGGRLAHPDIRPARPPRRVARRRIVPLRQAPHGLPGVVAGVAGRPWVGAGGSRVGAIARLDRPSRPTHRSMGRLPDRCCHGLRSASRRRAGPSGMLSWQLVGQFCSRRATRRSARTRVDRLRHLASGALLSLLRIRFAWSVS